MEIECNALYAVDARNTKLIPTLPGIYVYSDGFNIYCGKAKSNLRKRIPNSLRKQKFGKVAFLLPIQKVQEHGKEAFLKTLRYLEVMCIRSIFTFIYGHGLPYEITNIYDVEPLPAKAWTPDGAKALELPISIARTVLYGLGCPVGALDMPHHLMFAMGHFPAMQRENSSRWADVVSAEMTLRKNPLHQRSPLHIIHVR